MKHKKIAAGFGVTGVLVATLLGMTAGPAMADQNEFVRPYDHPIPLHAGPGWISTETQCNRARDSHNSDLKKAKFFDPNHRFYYCAPGSNGAFNLWLRQP